MAAVNTIQGDLYVSGNAKFGSVTFPINAVGNNEVKSGDPITYDKLQHQRVALYTQTHGTAVATKREVIYVSYAPGTLLQILAGLVVACTGDSTIGVDLYKNGSTILSTTITLDAGNTAFNVELGAFSSTSYNENDVFEVVVTATVGTGTLGQGLFVQLTTKESAEA